MCWYEKFDFVYLKRFYLVFMFEHFFKNIIHLMKKKKKKQY